MTTQIIYGNPNPILEMQKTLSKISTNLTPPPHMPFPLIQQISFCCSKSGQSHLLTFTHAAFLLIAWKLIFRRGVVLWSHSKGLPFQQTCHFFFLSSYLILSFQTLNHEEILYENSLISHPLHFHNTCLPHGKPYLIKLNFIFDSSFPCCAWLCCHTHVSSSCLCFSSILPLPCSCIMSFISIMPTLNSINRFGTNMYTLYASI